MNIVHRLRFVLFSVTGVILVVATVLTLRNDTPGDPEAVRGHLGPTPGPSSEGYIRAKRTYLEGVASTDPEARAAALVSYRSYVPATSVQRMVRGMDATFVWVTFPGSQAEPIPIKTTIAGALADAAADYRKALAIEVKDLQAQAATAAGSQKADLQALVTEQETALKKVNADCGCVFAVSVQEAKLGSLKSLLDVASVRHVDVPDPVTNDLSGWELQPFVPTGT